MSVQTINALLKPTRDSHTNWTANNPVVPAGVFCITTGRIYTGSIEYFVGDGVSTYSNLKKFGDAESHHFDLGEQKNSVFDPDCTKVATFSSLSDVTTFLNDNHVTTGKFGTLKLNQSITINGSGIDGSNKDWLIAGFNFYYNVGSTNILTTPHLALIPKTDLGNAVMNDTNTTEGGYVASKMHTTTMATVTTNLNAVLGSHLLTVDRCMTTTINSALYGRFGSASGAASANAWTATRCDLMTEENVYGNHVWSSSGYDTGEGKDQLPLFKYITSNKYGRSAFWLRSVASASYFCASTNDGYTDYGNASNSVGVRPLIFLG